MARGGPESSLAEEEAPYRRCDGAHRAQHHMGKGLSLQRDEQPTHSEDWEKTRIQFTNCDRHACVEGQSLYQLQ